MSKRVCWAIVREGKRRMHAILNQNRSHMLKSYPKEVEACKDDKDNNQCSLDLEKLLFVLCTWIS